MILHISRLYVAFFFQKKFHKNPQKDSYYLKDNNVSTIFFTPQPVPPTGI